MPIERTKPDSSLDANETISPALGGSPPNHTDFKATVIVWDGQNSRFQIVQGVIAECAARSRRIRSLLPTVEVETASRCGIALVGLGGRPGQADSDLSVIRALKQQDLKIICYDDGAHAWPLGEQCQPLLAGSLRLLDSARADFAQELRALLEQLLQAETSRRSEEKKIRAVMKELGIVGESQAMISIFRWVLRVGVLSDLPVLITGETGTGKQILANAISRLDPKRRSGPFVALNCGAIAANLAESELFGHRRGAFTGADRHRKGLVRSAHGGILFLDEIGELDDGLQTKLLRMLQEKSVLGVGEDQETPVDVRVIAATNRDLDQMVQQRKFRADLFHRLNVLSIRIPPLAQRPADVKPLIEHFLDKYRYMKPGSTLSAAADFLDALVQAGLPGNVRQLENMVRQVLVNKEDDSPLSLSDLPIEIWQQLSKGANNHGDGSPSGNGTKHHAQSPAEILPQDLPSHLAKMLDTNGWHLSRSLKWCERFFLEAALRKASGNQSQTARLLGITPRSVYNKLRKHNLSC
jgi:transcriptional regulator with PAS, ATPase and Fis domain